MHCVRVVGRELHCRFYGTADDLKVYKVDYPVDDKTVPYTPPPGPTPTVPLSASAEVEPVASSTSNVADVDGSSTDSTCAVLMPVKSFYSSLYTVFYFCITY